MKNRTVLCQMWVTNMIHLFDANRSNVSAIMMINENSIHSKAQLTAAVCLESGTELNTGKMEIIREI